VAQVNAEIMWVKGEAKVEKLIERELAAHEQRKNEQ
jgi:hypothetical protein